MYIVIEPATCPLHKSWVNKSYLVIEEQANPLIVSPPAISFIIITKDIPTLIATKTERIPLVAVSSLPVEVPVGTGLCVEGVTVWKGEEQDQLRNDIKRRYHWGVD